MFGGDGPDVSVRSESPDLKIDHLRVALHDDILEDFLGYSEHRVKERNLISAPGCVLGRHDETKTSWDVKIKICGLENGLSIVKSEVVQILAEALFPTTLVVVTTVMVVMTVIVVGAWFIAAGPAPLVPTRVIAASLVTFST